VHAPRGSTATSLAVEFSSPVYPDRRACEDAATLVGLERGAPVRRGALEPGYYLGVTPGTTVLRVVGDYDPALIPFLQRRHVSAKRDEVTHWSAASRSRMVRAIAELDLGRWLAGAGDAVLLTLTLPGDWLSAAPSGRAFKRLVRAFWARWERDIGRVRCIWKLEFQERGAPHLHALVKAPTHVGARTFEAWARHAWAAVVDTPDPVQRRLHEMHGVDVAEGYTMTDPRRVAAYFTKHSAKGSASKEYQHRVPEEWTGRGRGPGRFWGYRGLSRACTWVAISRTDFYRTRRMIQGIARGDQARIVMQNAHRAGLPGARLVPPRRRRRQSAGGAWVLVKSGPRVALTLAEALTRGDPPRGPSQLPRI